MFDARAAKNPQTPPGRLARLARSASPELRALVALNPSTPAEALRALSTDSSTEVLVGLARNPSCTPLLLEELSRSKHEAVRVSVAENQATPLRALTEISASRKASASELLALAGNASASASVLSSLCRWGRSLTHADWQLRVAVASHPNASEMTLRSLFDRDEKSPSQADVNAALAGNSATPLETRGQLFSMARYRRAVLDSEPSTKASTRSTAARTATGDVAHFLAHHPDPQVRRALALSRGVSRDDLGLLEHDAAPEVAAVAHARTATDIFDLERLSTSSDPLVLEALLRNPNLSPALEAVVSAAIVGNAEGDSLFLVAGKASTPSGVLHALVRDTQRLGKWDASRIKGAVASHPAATPETLAVLGTDKDPAVRKAAAEAAGVPIERLVQLAADTEQQVREGAAKNRATPAELLRRLASDDALPVVEAVAANPQATAEVLEHLVNHELNRRASGQQRLTSAELFDAGALVGAAAHPNTPPGSLATLAESVEAALKANRSPWTSHIEREAAIWKAIAANPSATPGLLHKLAGDVIRVVWTKDASDSARSLDQMREAILRRILDNPSVSMGTLEFLSNGDWVARQTATESERDDGHTFYWTVWDGRATAAAADEMASRVRTRIAERQWEELADSAEPVTFASNPDTPEAILDELSTHTDVAVRTAVAVNPGTSPEVFLRLARDVAVEVRSAAAAATHPDPPTWTYARFERERGYRRGFDLLSGDEDPRVRAAVASNSAAFWGALSDSARSELFFDSDGGVRAALVNTIAGWERSYRDWGVSTRALCHLINTGDREAWSALAAHHSALPREVLNQLAATGDPMTMAGLAGDRRLSHNTLLQLARSSHAEVIELVCLQVRDRKSREERQELALALLSNPHTPESFLREVSTGTHFRQRRRTHDMHARDATASPASPAEGSGTSEFSAQQDEPSVPKLASLTPRELSDDDRLVRAALAHPNFPEDLLIALASGNDVVLIRAAAQTNNLRALVAAASNSASPPDVFDILTDTREQAVRDALLDNKSTPPEALVRLIRAGRE